MIKNTKKRRYRKGVYIDIYSEDWQYFKMVCALRGKSIREAVSEILEPEITRSKNYIKNLPDYESIMTEFE